MSAPHSINFTRLFLLSLTLICFFSSETSAQVQTLTVELAPPTRVAVGEDLTLKVTATPVTGVPLPTIETVELLGRDGFFDITSTTPGTGAPQDGVYSFTLKAKTVTDTREITVKMGGKEAKFTVAIVPQITKDTLELDPAKLLLPTEKLVLKQQSQETVRVKLKDGTPIPAGALKAVSDATNIATVSPGDPPFVVSGVVPGSAKVTISAYGKEVLSFSVQVTETVKDIKVSPVLKVTKGEPDKLLSDLGIEMTGKAGTLWAKADAVAKLSFFSNRTDVVRISSDGTKLEIVDAGEAQLRISAKEDSSISTFVNVTVVPKASQVNLNTGNLVVVARQPANTVQATVVDSAGRLVPGVAVKFECEVPADCVGKVNVTNKSDNSAEVRGLSKATAVKIIAKVVGDASVTPGSLLIDVIGPDQITDFRPLLIRMDMIDEQTAKDLFGRKAVDEFYIAKVQLFNKIKKTDTEYFGDSILVYSESLQVRVALEMKCRKGDSDKGANTISECANNEGQWMPITAEMIAKYFKKNFSLAPYISGTEPRPRKDDPEPCTVEAPLGFVGLYRPYSFETIAVTHDRRDERSLRSRILTVINGAISFTSFVTAIAVPGKGSDLPLGLDKSNNLLVPSFEKLFPSMREVQRQNVLTMVMRQLEEIPFGGSVERKIFFPKGALEGLWPGHRVRISGVSTFDACAEAAIIKKVSQQ